MTSNKKPGRAPFLAALMLAVALLATPFTARAYYAGFSDVSASDWYVTGGYLDYVLRAGLMTGYEDGRFGPRDSVARSQVVTVLWRVAGEPDAAEGTPRFPDCDYSESCFYAEAVSWALEAGVVTGYEDGRFGPADPVTREQLSTMLARYAGNVEGLDVSSDGVALSAMADSSSVTLWDGMAWAVDEGILTGDMSTGVPLAMPQGSALREQLAKMITVFHRDILEALPDDEPGGEEGEQPGEPGEPGEGQEPGEPGGEEQLPGGDDDQNPGEGEGQQPGAGGDDGPGAGDVPGEGDDENPGTGDGSGEGDGQDPVQPGQPGGGDDGQNPGAGDGGEPDEPDEPGKPGTGESGDGQNPGVGEESRGRYAAYLDKVAELQASYGPATLVNGTFYGGAVKWVDGLCLVDLKDFGDGQERLLTAWRVPSARPEFPNSATGSGGYWVAIWNYDEENDAVVREWSGSATEDNGGFYHIEITKGVDGRLYYLQVLPEAFTVLGLDDSGSFGYVGNFGGYYQGRDYVYVLDGAVVSSEEYWEALDRFGAGTTDSYLTYDFFTAGYMGVGSPETMLRVTEETIAKLRA